MMWLLQHLLARDSLPSLLGAAVLVLLLCGAGFWWIEPRTPTLADGLWLAFTTAATVGYGDVVPSTPASKVFAVFVVLLGFGILSLVTASIAAMWVESSERRMEHDILRDLHAEIGQLRAELRATHDELQSLRRRLDQPP
ncbi:ion transporter [Sphaerotilus montanus]|nr:ion transporter [Sphaerotilus montanus]